MAMVRDAFDVEMRRRLGDGLGAARSVGPRFAYPLAFHMATRFVDRRLALVGDSAHGLHPIAGQGLNLGLRDTAALAEVLADGARLGLDPGTTRCSIVTNAGGGSIRWSWVRSWMASTGCSPTMPCRFA